MEINYSLKKSSGQTCVALGYFDGLHLGHQKVIKKTVEKALLTKTLATVFTFRQNPKIIIKNIKIKNILTQQEKEKILSNLGIDLLYCVDFLKIMNLSPTEFVEKILVNKLQAKYVFCGFNFHFGKNALADSYELFNICKKYDIKVYIINPVKFEGTVISSSQIRDLIKSGNNKKVDELLGYK